MVEKPLLRHLLFLFVGLLSGASATLDHHLAPARGEDHVLVVALREGHPEDDEAEEGVEAKYGAQATEAERFAQECCCKEGYGVVQL